MLAFSVAPFSMAATEVPALWALVAIVDCRTTVDAAAWRPSGTSVAAVSVQSSPTLCSQTSASSSSTRARAASALSVLLTSTMTLSSTAVTSEARVLAKLTSAPEATRS